MKGAHSSRPSAGDCKSPAFPCPRSPSVACNGMAPVCPKEFPCASKASKNFTYHPFLPLQPECDLQEQWYGTQYSLTPLPSDWLELWRSGGQEHAAALHLPAPNPFIPSEFDMIPVRASLPFSWVRYDITEVRVTCFVP